MPGHFPPSSDSFCQLAGGSTRWPSKPGRASPQKAALREGPLSTSPGVRTQLFFSIHYQEAKPPIVCSLLPLFCLPTGRSFGFHHILMGDSRTRSLSKITWGQPLSQPLPSRKPPSCSSPGEELHEESHGLSRAATRSLLQML